MIIVYDKNRKSLDKRISLRYYKIFFKFCKKSVFTLFFCEEYLLRTTQKYALMKVSRITLQEDCTLKKYNKRKCIRHCKISKLKSTFI